MDKPSRDGASYDCWTAAVGQLDVHYSSGVGNHFFYLLAEGSGAKTLERRRAQLARPATARRSTGIGRDAAAKIWYRALTVYMTSNTNYAGARTATLNAAQDLYGARQHAVQRGRRRLERGQRQLTRPRDRGCAATREGPRRTPVRALRASGPVERRSRPAATAAPKTTTRNGARSSSSTTATARPGARASTTRAGRRAEHLDARPGRTSSATGIRSATRSTTGCSSTAWRHREPGQLEQVAADAGEQDRQPRSSVTPGLASGRAGRAPRRAGRRRRPRAPGRRPR